MLKSSIRTIGVMTSGGDAPGMNPGIRAVVRAGLAQGLRVLGVEDGYEGMLHGKFRELGPRDVGGILQRGGTFLRTARSMEMKTPQGQRQAIRNLNNAGIEALVILGGDGSLTGGTMLMQQGVPVVGIPASIDNDIYGTDMCIGVDTALNTIVDAIDKLRDTASSHNRAFIIETMGRACGYLAVRAGIITGAEMVLVPEVETPFEDVVAMVDDAYKRGKAHAIIVVAEGASIRAQELAQKLEDLDLGFDTRVTVLGHVQRGGKPTAFDRYLATRFGVKAVEFIVSGQFGVMTALDGRDIIPVPLQQVISKKQTLSQEALAMARILAR
ncbi:MAG: 6-phosphofructokinase [Anaerolineaceae bacterium]|nr:6-phosphofructokinase [Anaerolineaceae bacterium]